MRASFGVRRYRHDELEGDEVGTKFKNDTTQFEVLANTQPLFGRLQGSYGVSGLTRAFAAEGEEALAPPIDSNNVAAFTYQELPWSHVTLQFGGRVERTSFTPDASSDLIDRDFTNVSGSAGILFRPSDATTVAVSLARAVRNPALEELYFFGVHPGNFAFEIGDANLDAEKALGFDVSFRWRLRARVRRGQLLPQQHRQLHLPQSDRRGGRRLPGDPVHRRRQPAAGRRGAHRHRDLAVVGRRSGLRHGARRAARDRRAAAADPADRDSGPGCAIATTRCRRAATW